MFVRYKLTTLGVCGVRLDFGLNLRSKLRGRAAQQMARVGSLSSPRLWMDFDIQREKLVKIGAKVVSHARYVTFQMAEVLVSKSLFYEILARIHRLKPVPNGYD